MHEVVVNAMTEFFVTSWILPNYNTNILTLIPNNPKVDSIDQYVLIALANVKFKIISTVLVDRLTKILPYIISGEQRGFVHGKNIKYCICLAFEAMDSFHKIFFWR